MVSGGDRPVRADAVHQLPDGACLAQVLIISTNLLICCLFDNCQKLPRNTLCQEAGSLGDAEQAADHDFWPPQAWERGLSGTGLLKNEKDCIEHIHVRVQSDLQVKRERKNRQTLESKLRSKQRDKEDEAKTKNE